MNGIVFQELRETRGLAYSAWAQYKTPVRRDGTESLQAHIISQNDKMKDCISAFGSILNNMPLSEKAFQLAKQAEQKRIATERTTKFSIIEAYLRARKLGIDYDITERIYKALPQLTLADIAHFEKETLSGKPYRYIILGDEKNLDMKVLKKMGRVRRVTTEEIFGF